MLIARFVLTKLFGDSGVDFGSIQVDNDNIGHHKDITTNFVHKKEGNNFHSLFLKILLAL